MSPDQVWEMCRVPSSSRRTRGPLSGPSGAPSFSQTYLCQGYPGVPVPRSLPAAGHQVALQDRQCGAQEEEEEEDPVSLPRHRTAATAARSTTQGCRDPPSPRTHLTSTLGSWVTPQLMTALVPLMTLWSCGGSVIRVRAAGGHSEGPAPRGWHRRGQLPFAPTKRSAHPRGAPCRCCPEPGRALPHRDPLTPHHQVCGGLVHAAGVGGQAGVGASVGQVSGAHQETPRFQKGEARQLHGAAGQDPLPWGHGRAPSVPRPPLWRPPSPPPAALGRQVCPQPCTFLPGDGRARRPRGLAVEDDGHAIDHRAVLGTPRDVGGDA